MKLRHLLLSLVLVGPALLCAPASQAALFRFFVNLSPLNEGGNAAIISHGTGNASLLLDTTAQTLTGNIAFSGLTTNTTAAHIHCCLTAPFLPGANVGVATLVPAFPGFPLGATSGTDSFVLDLTSAASYNPAFVNLFPNLSAAEAAFIAGLENGGTYLNIHTSMFPGGEIRGFVVPEPMTMSLVGLGLAAAGFVSRRRKS
jgi:hypothetical protein